MLVLFIESAHRDKTHMCLLVALWSALKPNGTAGTRQMGIPFGKPPPFLRDMSNFEYGIALGEGEFILAF